MLTVGIDIGGTNVKSALVRVDHSDAPDSYSVLKEASVRTDISCGKASVLRSVETAYRAVFTNGVQAVGVGSAGDVDPDTGVVQFATAALPGFTGLNLYETLNRRFRVPTVVINDASAATVGECFFGAGRGADSALVLTLGTGLGCSLFQNTGKDLTSKTVVNYRLGHVELHSDGRRCLCGLRGCAEQYVSATAIKQNAADERLPANVAALVRLYNKKNARAVRAVERFFRDFTDVLKHAEHEYRPGRIVVGGGVTEAEGWFEDFTAFAAEEVSVPVVKAQLKNKAGVLGAVFNALNGKYNGQKGVFDEKF